MADDSFDKLKARLVADGSVEDKDDYRGGATDMLYSPCVGLQSILLNLGLCAYERRATVVCDIRTAYLHLQDR